MNNKLDAKDPLNEYTIRESVYDEESRPAYQMAPIEGGVWKAITDLAKHPTEGWLSLWKGTYDSYGNSIRSSSLWRKRHLQTSLLLLFLTLLMIGQYTNWIYEMLHLFAQPTLEATLNDTFDLYDDTIPLVHLDHVGPNIATMVTSHLVVGLILSPLELVRTR